MKALVGLLSDGAVLRSKMEGLCPDKFRHDAQNADNARKNTAFPPVCKKCAKVCKHPEKRKSHEESYDSSWDFGALEGTRIPGPLIKSQMLYRLSYERIMVQYTILPNNITTPGQKKQEQNQNSPEVPLYKKCENQYNQSSTHAMRACTSERTNSTAGPGDAAGCRRF